MAVAMLLVGGLIAPAAADYDSNDEPNACQFVETEYEKVTTTTSEPDWFTSDPGGDWEATGGERDIDPVMGTEYLWDGPGSNEQWLPEGSASPTPTQQWTKTAESRPYTIEEGYTEFEYVEVTTTTETEWSTSDPGGDWEATGETRIVDIPDCDLFELDPSNPAAGQCDADEGAIKLDTGSDYSSTITVDGVKVEVTVSGTNVTFSEAVNFCVKAANGNSGGQSGTSYDVDFTNRGGNHPNISNVVIYGLVDDKDPEDNGPKDPAPKDPAPKDPAPKDPDTEVGGEIIDKAPEAKKPPTEVEGGVVVKKPVTVHTPVAAPSAPEQAQVLGKVITAKEMPRTGVPALALILMGLTSLGLGSSLVRRKRS